MMASTLTLFTSHCLPSAIRRHFYHLLVRP